MLLEKATLEKKEKTEDRAEGILDKNAEGLFRSDYNGWGQNIWKLVNISFWMTAGEVQWG